MVHSLPKLLTLHLFEKKFFLFWQNYLAWQQDAIYLRDNNDVYLVYDYLFLLVMLNALVYILKHSYKSVDP